MVRVAVSRFPWCAARLLSASCVRIPIFLLLFAAVLGPRISVAQSAHSQSAKSLKPSQLGKAKRSGSHSALRIDPADSCTLWLSNASEDEQLAQTFAWSLHLASMKFSNCSALVGTQKANATDLVRNPGLESRDNSGLKVPGDPTNFVFTTIMYPNDAFTQLLGINNSMVIAGYHNSTMNSGFTLTLPSTFTNENYPTALQTQVFGINKTTDTAGFYSVDSSGRTHGFTHIKGKFATVDNPSGDSTQLFGINDNLETSGYYVDSSGIEHPFTHMGTTFTELDPLLPTHAMARATGVNNSGAVSGFFVDNAEKTHGFLLNGTTVTTLDFPGATLTQALGLNNAGQLVGSYNDDVGGTHGFVYSVSSQQFQSYDDPFSVGTTVINGINDGGVIVGFYGVGAVCTQSGVCNGFVGIPAVSTTVLSSSKNPSNLNDPVTFTATVTGNADTIPTGTVGFTYGSTLICGQVPLSSNGTAMCTTQSLPAGSDLITAAYSGDSTYPPSSGTLTQVVKFPSSTALSSSPNPSNLNQLVTFNATLTGSNGTPTGTVGFTYNGNVICGSVTLSQGTAICTTQSLPLGSEPITAQYSGDSTYATSSATLVQTVVVSGSAPTCTLAVQGAEPSDFITQFTVKAIAQCTDPQNKPLTTSIDWGDNTSGTFSGGSLNLTHTYTAPPLIYQIIVTATDTLELQGQVAEFTTLVPASQAPAIFAGQSAQFTGNVTSTTTASVSFMCTTVIDASGVPKQASDLGITCSSIPAPVSLMGQMRPQPVPLLIMTSGSASGVVTVSGQTSAMRMQGRGVRDQASDKHRTRFYALWLPLASFLCLGFGTSGSRRVGIYRYVGLIGLIGLLLLLTSCGGGFTLPGQGAPPQATPPGCIQVTIVGTSNTSGFVQISLIVPLCVSQSQP